MTINGPKILLSLLFALSIFPVHSLGDLEIRKVFSEGSYNLNKGQDIGNCPQINIVFQKMEDGTRLLMLDPRYVIDLGLLNTEKSEKVPKGCHYNYSLKYQNQTFTKTTSRFDCPKPSENGVVKEVLSSTPDGLSFKIFLNDKVQINCSYFKEEGK